MVIVQKQFMLQEGLHLKNHATALKVLHTAVRFANAEIQLMYKILRSDDESDFDELGFRFFNTNGDGCRRYHKRLYY